MKRFVFFCAAALTCCLTACNQSTDTKDADIKAVQANEAQWNQDWLAKDTSKIAGHYADDAILMVPGSPAVTGRSAIESSLKQMTADPAISLKFKADKVDVANSGDLAFTQGTYTLTLTDPHTGKVINDHGSYVTTYRKQPDGSWKAVADIATSDVPPPSAPSST